MKIINRLILIIPAALLVFFLTDTAQAQPVNQGQSTEAVEEILVVGSRRRDRSADDSPVPVDVIDGDDFLTQGDSDLDSLLAALVPSYNVAQEPISDAATFIRPATLRSLPPDATLVLVNGKRRHRAAVIALLGAGISGGSQGPDLSVIPAIALDRLEVLRDGASAQYGSDAIAGIMNFVLKEDNQGFALDAKYGNHYEGDGDAITIAGNAGFALTDAGFANISFEFKESDPTSRSAQRGDAQSLINAGNSHVRQPAAQIWGAPEISDDFKVFGNFGIDLGNGSEAYMFGNWAERQVEGGFYYRNPHTRGGVFRGPVLDANRNEVFIRNSDRISFTSRFDLTPEDTQSLLAAGVSDASSFASVRFFSNQQTVKASGIDLVTSAPFEIGSGDSTFTFVANWSDVELSDFNPEFTDENRKLQIERGRPDMRFTTTWTHRVGVWRFMSRVRNYGEYYDAPTNDETVAFYPQPSTVFDFEAGYEVNESLSIMTGLQNAFDEYPSTNPHGEVAGLIYPEQSPFSFNGGFYYLRATWNAI